MQHKKTSRVYLNVNSSYFHCKHAVKIEEGMRIFFALLNEHSSHHSLLNLAFHKKTPLSLLLLVFFFFRAITLIRIWFRKGSLYGLSVFWYLIISFTIECIIFIPFVIDYLIFIFLTCWYIFISSFFFFFFLNTWVLLLSVRFDVFSLRIFIFFLKSKKESHFFALLCFGISCQGLRYHEVLFLL